MQPNYIVMGAAKCGSTTLSALLGAHPEVYMVPHEVHFFSKDEIYDKGMEWYESLFPKSKQFKCVGENSNTYTMAKRFPNTLGRLLRYHANPSQLKLIYIVRNPLAMLESFWIEKRSHGGEAVHYDFNIAIKNNTDQLLDVAKYWQQLKPYIETFSSKQIHVVFLEDLKTEQHQTITNCYRFLGLDLDIKLDLNNIQLNSYKDKRVTRPLKSKLRAIKGYEQIVSLLPKPIKHILNERLLSEQINSRPQWHPETRDWVLDKIHEDTIKFLTFSGKPSDFWKL